ncbi:hypothetical protein MVEN_00031600 [Mycena venus]|uniref:Uncharacterized protein n=1 Tax=Mycena venus TaxID=2733690 RepID=A0A8H6Z8J4_9AGAR|nr:hypothetical protein MVEN_00031600 [Mycena venus]
MRYLFFPYFAFRVEAATSIVSVDRSITQIKDDVYVSLYGPRLERRASVSTADMYACVFIHCALRMPTHAFAFQPSSRTRLSSISIHILIGHVFYGSFL